MALSAAHSTDDRTEARTGSCPACRTRDPEPEDGRVCGPCRRWLPVALRSIVEKTAELPELVEPEPLVDGQQYWHWHPRRRDPVTKELLPPEGEWRYRQPLAPVGGAGAVPGERRAPRVSGTRDPAAPVRLDVLDLLAPVVREGGRPVDGLSVDSWATKVPRVEPGAEVELRVRQLRMVPIRDKDDWIVDERLEENFRTSVVRERRLVLDRLVSAGDQVGQVPVAAVLDQEVRAWIDAGAPGARFRPVPTVPVLAHWLLNRLDWACDNYEPIDEFVAVLRRLRGVLMAALDEFDPEPEPCRGVECNRCDQRMLFRRNDGTGDVFCDNPDCAKVFSAKDYAEWVKHLGAYERSQRSSQEVAALLRPTYRPPPGGAPL